MINYNFKKSLAAILAVVSVASSIPTANYISFFNTPSITASAAEIAHGECGDNLFWSLDDKGILTFSGTGTATPDYTSLPDASGSLTLPPWYEYRSSIKELAFNNDNPIYIGNYAFYNCAITSLELPSSVTLGSNVFEKCTSLVSALLPINLNDTSEGLFSGCEMLYNVTLPSGIKSIKSHMFEGCTSIKEITIPLNVTEISDEAFKNCSNLSEISLPNELEKISENAFMNCSGLKNICIPERTDVSDSAFDGCTNLTHVFINGSNVKKFCSGVFEGWGNAVYHVPSNVLEAYKTSENWADLADKITSWPSVTFSGGGVIPDSTFLSSVDYKIPPYSPKLPKGAKFFGWFTDKELENPFDFSQIISNDKTVYPSWYLGGECGNDLSWTIDESGVLTISGNGTAMNSFESASDAPWSELKHLISAIEITAPNLKNISNRAFYMTPELTSINIGNVETVGDSAFADCPYLKTVTLNAENAVIEENAFKGCSALERITVPADSADTYKTSLPQYADLISDGISAKLAGHSLSVNGDITVNFCVDIIDMNKLKNGELRFSCGTLNIPAVSVSKAEKTADGKYYIFSASVPAKNMYDRITAQFCVNGNSVGQIYDFNICEYADALKENHTEYSDFVDALLEYGCQAAAYFNVKSAPSPKNSLYSYSDILTALSDYGASPDTNKDYVGTSLLLKSKLILRNYYSSNVKNSVPSSLKPGLYCIETEFSPSEFSKKLDGCCVYNYIYRVLNSDKTDAKLKNVCSSLYYLSQAFINMSK